MEFKLPNPISSVRIKIAMSRLEESIYSSPVGRESSVQIYRESSVQTYWEHRFLDRFLVRAMRDLHGKM